LPSGGRSPRKVDLLTSLNDPPATTVAKACEGQRCEAVAPREDCRARLNSGYWRQVGDGSPANPERDAEHSSMGYDGVTRVTEDDVNEYLRKSFYSAG